MRKSLLGGLLAALTLTPLTASAVGPLQQDSVSFIQWPTYSASVVALVPAGSATDILTITGSATKMVSVNRVACSGTSTANGSSVVQLVLRSTADTGGTSTTPTVVKMDPTGNANAPTAVVRAYTANPATLGTTIGAIRSANLLTNIASAGGSGPLLAWIFGIEEAQPPTLRGVTQVLALNGNGATLAAGATLQCDLEWTER